MSNVKQVVVVLLKALEVARVEKESWYPVCCITNEITEIFFEAVVFG